MNPQWNTPPDGDFARYVERLSAQAALPRHAPQEGEHGLDVGMTPSPSPSQQGAGATASAVQRRASSKGGMAAGAPQVGVLLSKVLLAVGGVVLLLMWMAGAPVGVLIMVVAGSLWLAYKLRQIKVPGGGVAKWQQVLEEAARKQREQQQRQGK